MKKTLAWGAWGLLLAIATGCSEDSGASGAGGFVVPDRVCFDFCDKVVDECDAFQIPTMQCQSQCQRDVDSAFDDSRTCGEGIEEFYECVSGLACEDVEVWRDANPDDDYPCRASVEAANEACEPST